MKKVLSERDVPVSVLGNQDTPQGLKPQDARSENTCRCRKFAIDPTCERHGRR